jgi:hypothetical protein
MAAGSRCFFSAGLQSLPSTKHTKKNLLYFPFVSFVDEFILILDNPEFKKEEADLDE